MSPVDPKYIVSAVALIALVVLVYFVTGTMSKKLKGLQGYGRLVYVAAFGITISIVAGLAYIWGVLQVFLGSVAAAGALGLVLLFGVLPLMTDIINGVLVHLDPDINVGVDVEIDGKRGVIEEISLTRTKIVSPDGVIIFPNRRFRETAVIVRPNASHGR